MSIDWKELESRLQPGFALGDSRDARAVVASGTPGEGGLRMTRFAVDAASYATLRFDPANGSGLFRIIALRWIDDDNSTNRIEWRLGALDARIVHINGVRLPSDTTSATVFLALDDRPQVTFAWHDISGSGVLEIEWSAEFATKTQLAGVVRRLLDPQALAPPAARVDYLDGAATAVRLEALNTAVQEARSTVAVQVGELRAGDECLHASLTTERTARSADVQAIGEVLDALSARVASLDSDTNTRIGALMQSLQELLADTAGRFEAMASARHRAEAQVAGLQAQVNALDAALQRAQHWAAMSWWRHPQRLPSRILRFTSAWFDFVRPRRCVAKPCGDLERISGDGDCVRWRGTATDPRFQLAAARFDLSPGWYLLTCRLELHGERVLVDSCLYADYGAGANENTRIPLHFDQTTSTQKLLVKFEGTVGAIRFDPSILPCEFTLGPITLRKLTRSETLIRLVGPSVGKVIAARQLGVSILGFLRALTTGGVSEVERLMRLLVANNNANDNYAAWASHFDAVGPHDIARMGAMIDVMAPAPKISIVVPVYNTPERWLRRCIDSVLAQVYPHWELCLADDASTKPHVRKILAEYAARDPRIKPVYRARNGHISAASNSAIEIATGDYCALLDHDDELPVHALFMVAERISRDPGIDIVYSDEDKIDEDGRRYDPYFKPDWNPDLFLSQNYLSHLGVYRTQLVRDVGGFREGFEGSQDYDLALRCVERVDPAKIAHLPFVLYHWRAIRGSTALATGEKSYARDAGLRALREHFVRTGENVTVEEHGLTYYRRRYALPESPPLVSLLIPTRDKAELLRMSVGTILERSDYPNYEIVIVDNQSSEQATFDYFAEIAADPRVRVVRYDRPFNFSSINNFAVGHAKGELVGLINNDIEVTHPEWLGEMVSHALRPGVGAVGAKLYYPDGRIQHAGVILGFGGVAGHAYQWKPHDYNGQMSRCHLVQNLTGVTAACLLIRREHYEAVGGLEEALQVAFNDIDFCLRVEALGLRHVWTPYAELNHHESASRGYEDSPEKLKRFHGEVAFMQQRWGKRVIEDPAYSPNLDIIHEPYRLAWPPRATFPFRATAGHE